MIAVKELQDAIGLIQRHQAPPAGVLERTRAIVQDVLARGDEALRHWTRQLDDCDLADPFLTRSDWDHAAALVDDGLRQAMKANLARIEAFHSLQVGAPAEMEVVPGLWVGRHPVPFETVACYVPGGRASYPSTVLMTVVPARLAGVQRILVVTPPRADGSVDPAVCVAARLAGATDIVRAGGAQAVAALGHGTKRLPRVDAIVGPGNHYVTAAKAMVEVHTDAPAGPSELLVLADAAAPADRIAWEMVAQAEHDPEARVVLVTPSGDLARRVAAALDTVVATVVRKNIVTASLRTHGALLVAPDMEAALRYVDAFAPEHLVIMTRSPREHLAAVHHAGSVFLGADTPVALGDYGSGTNHVLPTMGHARLRGGLCVDDFRKWITWQEAEPRGLAAVAGDIVSVAQAEGLHAHSDSITRRLEDP